MPHQNKLDSLSSIALHKVNAVMHVSLARFKRKPSEHLQSLRSNPIPDGEIQAGNAAEKSLDNADIMNRSRLVTTSPARMPYIGLRGKYNRHWYVDAVTLPHNSIRILLSRLFSIITIVQRLALDMTRDDFAKVFAYIHQFDHYIRVLFEAEEKILYPSVASGLRRVEKYASNHPLHPAARAVMKQGLGTRLIKLHEIQPMDISNIEKASLLQKAVDEFASTLLDYYSAKEKLLPRIVETSVRGSRERTRMERHLIKFFANLDLEFRFSVLLTVPLKTEEVRKEFINRHFSTAKRKLFNEAEAEVEKSFFSVPKEFEKAAAKYESKFSMDEFLSHYGQVDEAEIDYDDDLNGNDTMDASHSNMNDDGDDDVGKNEDGENDDDNDDNFLEVRI